MKRRFIVMALALAVVFGGLLAWNAVRRDLQSKYLEKHRPGPKAVTVMAVQEQAWQSLLSAVGTLEAIQNVQVTTQVGGRVTEISFEDGQEVKQGDLLLVLDDAVQRAELAQAVTQRDAARDTVKQYKPLLEEGAISQLHYDNLEAKYRESSAQVDQAQALLEHVRVTAPFSGRVGIRQVSLGQLVEPGAPVVTLDTRGTISCEFNLPESDRAEVFVGQDVQLQTDTSPGKSFAGKISAIDPEVDATSPKFRVRASFPNADDKLTPGALAKVQVLLAAGDQVIAVPRTAIAYTLYGDRVYVLDPDSQQERDGKQAFQVKKLAVTPGEERGSQVVISKGLQAGQKIVTSGQLKLEDGDWVTPQPSEPPLD